MEITKLVVLGVYVAILFIIGIVASRRIKGMSDYYVGGKQMGFWAVAFSARATGESGWLLIGLTGLGAMAGYSGYWVVAGELLGVYLSWQFMAKRFKRRSDKYNAITIPDYLQSHFKSSTNTLRIIAASVLVVFVVIYVASQMDVTGIAFESMLNIDYRIGALIGFFIVLLYIFIGGFVAAVWSDMFQGILMFFGLVLLPIVIWFNMDHGLGITEGLNAIDPTLTQVMGRSPDGLMNLFTILGFSMIGLGFLGSPQVYVRFMSIKSEKEIDKGKWVAFIDVPCGGHTAVIDRCQIDGDGAMPFVSGQRRHGLAHGRPTCVIYPNREFAKSRLGCNGQCLERIGVGHIRGNGDRLAPSLNNPFSYRFDFLRSARCDGDLGTGTREVHRDALANTSTRAGDYGNVVLERKPLHYILHFELSGVGLLFHD